VTYEAPPPAPPPAPCKVPSLVNEPSTVAHEKWAIEGHFTGILTFARERDLPYTIKTQTLVGGTYVACESNMTVSNR
jgi:hypothetical protein